MKGAEYVQYNLTMIFMMKFTASIKKQLEIQGDRGLGAKYRVKATAVKGDSLELSIHSFFLRGEACRFR